MRRSFCPCRPAFTNGTMTGREASLDVRHARKLRWGANPRGEAKPAKPVSRTRTLFLFPVTPALNGAAVDAKGTPHRQRINRV